MKSEPIEGATAWDRAVAVAGRLAERGVKRLQLTTAAGAKQLDARVTDLPTAMASAVSGVVRTAGIEVSFGPDAAEWREA